MDTRVTFLAGPDELRIARHNGQFCIFKGRDEQALICFKTQIEAESYRTEAQQNRTMVQGTTVKVYRGMTVAEHARHLQREVAVLRQQVQPYTQTPTPSGKDPTMRSALDQQDDDYERTKFCETLHIPPGAARDASHVERAFRAHQQRQREERTYAQAAPDPREADRAAQDKERLAKLRRTPKGQSVTRPYVQQTTQDLTAEASRDLLVTRIASSMKVHHRTIAGDMERQWLDEVYATLLPPPLPSAGATQAEVIAYDLRKERFLQEVVAEATSMVNDPLQTKLIEPMRLW